MLAHTQTEIGEEKLIEQTARVRVYAHACQSENHLTCERTNHRGPIFFPRKKKTLTLWVRLTKYKVQAQKSPPVTTSLGLVTQNINSSSIPYIFFFSTFSLLNFVAHLLIAFLPFFFNWMNTLLNSP